MGSPKPISTRISTDLEHATLSFAGLRFDTFSTGPRSGQLVLFLHGFPQFADAWAPIMDRVAQLPWPGYRCVAVDQRGYSPGARPPLVADYAAGRLDADVLSFASQLGGGGKFHLVGHDWGGLVAWRFAARHPELLHSLTVLSTPHEDAFKKALASDPDQVKRSKYILLFRGPKGLAETALLGGHAHFLRRAYQGRLPAAQVDANVERFSQDGTLTAALNWYRALDMSEQIGNVIVPTLYIWGDQDLALGQTAALATAGYVKGPYRFERLEGKSHWLLEEVPETIVSLLQQQLQAFSS